MSGDKQSVAYTKSSLIGSLLFWSFLIACCKFDNFVMLDGFSAILHIVWITELDSDDFIHVLRQSWVVVCLFPSVLCKFRVITIVHVDVQVW